MYVSGVPDTSVGAGVQRALRDQREFVGALETALRAELRPPVADVAPVPADRVEQHAGPQGRNHVPRLAGQQAGVVVLDLDVGVPQQHGALVLDVDLPLEVEFDLAAHLRAPEQRNRRTEDVESQPRRTRVDVAVAVGVFPRPRDVERVVSGGGPPRFFNPIRPEDSVRGDCEVALGPGELLHTRLQFVEAEILNAGGGSGRGPAAGDIFVRRRRARHWSPPGRAGPPGAAERLARAAAALAAGPGQTSARAAQRNRPPPAPPSAAAGGLPAYPGSAPSTKKLITQIKCAVIVAS